MRITLRLSQEDGQKVKDKARDRRMTVSGLIRDIILDRDERQNLTDAMQHLGKSTTEELKAVSEVIKSIQLMVAENNRMLGQINRRVDLLARSSPIVSKWLSEGVR